MAKTVAKYERLSLIEKIRIVFDIIMSFTKRSLRKKDK